MRALITGVAGFIGSSIADRLLADGWDVTGIDNLTTGRLPNVARDVSFMEGDIRDGLPQGEWDVIYHCAASYRDRDDWERDSSTNVYGTVRAVREAQRSGARLVYFQTSLCYGPNPPSPVALDAPLDPRGSYAVSKTAGECYIRDSGVSYVSLRLANVYGPRNLSGPVPTFYKRLAHGEQCVVVDARRDFVFIDDLVRVAVQAARYGRGAYHVSSGHDVSIGSLYEAVSQAVGGGHPEPERRARGSDDVAALLLDPHETFTEYGWAARTPLVAGVRRAVDWYRAHPVTETYTHLAMKG